MRGAHTFIAMSFRYTLVAWNGRNYGPCQLDFTISRKSIVSQRSSLELASFGFFGHKGWIQPSALTAGFHASVTIRNFKKLQYKRMKAIKNLK